MQKFDMGRCSAKFIIKEPFYGHVSRYVSKVPDESIATAGVRVNKRGKYEMLYSPTFFQGLTEEERFAVLKHEYLHIIFKHITSRKTGESDHKRWNIATDLAINSFLMNELPSCGLFPGRGEFKDFPVGLASERYYAMLKPMNLENIKEFDSHEGWASQTLEEEMKASSAIEAEIAQRNITEVLKSATKSKTEWGSFPVELRKELAKILGANKLDWNSVLRMFVQGTVRGEKRSTRRRINKRFGYAHAGHKVKRYAKLMIAIDMSGSVDDGMLEKFFGCLNNLSSFVDFHVVPFDTEVDEENIFLWKKGTTISAKRTRSGGTCFQAPTDYANKHNFDGLIVLTDLYAPVPGRCKCKRLWLTDSRHQDVSFDTDETILVVD